MTEINPFNDVKDVALPTTGDVGQANMPNIASLKIGAGDKSFKGDDSGIWLGANKFADAPFSVDLDGNVVATSLSLGDYLTKAGTSQVLTGDISMASNGVILDANGITINEGKITMYNDGDTLSIDAKGIVSNNNFTKTETSTVGLNQSITGTSEVDITNASLSFNIDRSKIVLVLFSTSNWLEQSSDNAANLTVRLRIQSDTGGAFNEWCRTINVRVPITDQAGHTYTNFEVAGYSAGAKTIKLTAQLETVTGNPTATIYDVRLSYIIFGT